MNNSPLILVTRPMKVGDPTEYTYQWGEEIIKMMRYYGYKVIDMRKNDVTYENVSKYIRYYKPRLYVHIGHGCPTSMQGQNECIVTRNFDMDELLNMSNFREIIQPLIYQTGCTHTCKTLPDICNPICTNPTNVNLLNGTIIYTVSCYTAAQLGNCAVKYGAETYIGFKDLMLFPVDDANSQDIFRNVHIVFLKELITGHTVKESLQKTERYENELISMYKKIKYMSLPLLWNKLNRRIIGNSGALLHE